MKSYNHLMEIYLTEDNYKLAVTNATRHKYGKKKKREQAQEYREKVDEYMPEILQYAEHYKNEHHTPILIYDGVRRKKRMIVVPTMREQIVHHMIVNVMKPIFQKGMYEHSYGSVPGRGAHLAKRRVEKWIRTGGRKIKYCLKMDIRKYFDSVPHDILKAKLAKIIHDEAFLQILDEVVDASPGDKGIPIGFYTSQWFANWYLEDLDHFIKEKLKAEYYIRYMDDMVIFGPNKRKLHKMQREIDRYLNDKLGLQMKSNWQVFLFDYVDGSGQRRGRDLDFMGFRFYRDKTLLRKALMIKACRKAKRIAKKDITTSYDARQMISYYGWFDITDTYGMYKRRIKPYVNYRHMTRLISNQQRRENLCGEESKTDVAQNQPQSTQHHQKNGTISEKTSCS